MKYRTYQIGPFVLRATVSLPFYEVEDRAYHATLDISRKSLNPPSECRQSQGIYRTSQGHWMIVEGRASSFISFTGKILITPLDEEMKLYSHVICAIRIFLIQQGVVLVHGSAIAKHGVAHVWLGRSGAGKSTSATVAVLAREATHLGDDVVPLWIDCHGRVVTFQCDRYAFLTTPFPKELGAFDALRRYHRGVRSDGKIMCCLSPSECEVYPVERIFYARPGTVGKEFVSTHAEKHKMLIQSVVSLKTIQESMGVKHLHVLSRLLAQCAQGKVLQDKDLNSSDIVATSSP